jgi:hypothetical protein
MHKKLAVPIVRGSDDSLYTTICNTERRRRLLPCYFEHADDDNLKCYNIIVFLVVVVCDRVFTGIVPVCVSRYPTHRINIIYSEISWRAN